MAVDKKMIEGIIGQHPSRKMMFDELYAGLLDNVKKGFITRRVKDDLEIFNYTPITMFEQNWNPYTLMSRGLILSPSQKKVVATPFPKFFNFGEIDIWDAEAHDGEILALEKLDGSLGIVYHHNEEWHCATRGAFDSDQAAWGQQWLRQNIDHTNLKVGHTYLFEIIYPENRIVVSYDYEGMVLLSAYCDNGFEYDSKRLHDFTEAANVKKAVHYPYVTIHDFVNKADDIDKNNEGWVIRFSNGHRVKIKGSEYCRVHRLISNVTPLGVWGWLVERADLKAIRKDLPEEHLRDFDAIHVLLTEQMSALIRTVNSSVEVRKEMPDKEVGLSISKGVWPDGKAVTEEERKFLFLARKFDLEEELNVGGRSCMSLYNYIKPKANKLVGYLPSKAVNRFQAESSQG